MPITNNRSMRDYVDPLQNTLSLLERDEPLPDDDPRTRNGGLKPSRKADLGQIEMYINMRQQGAISDTAWQRLIKRNPASAVLFSTIPAPKQTRQSVLSQYFSPEIPEKSFTEQDVGTGIGPLRLGQPIPGTGQPARRDTQNAINALLQAGDLAGAKELMGVIEPRQGSKARPLQIQTVDKSGRPITAIIDPETMKPIQEFPMTPKVLSDQAIEKLGKKSTAAEMFGTLKNTFKPQYAGFKSQAVGDARREYESRFGTGSEFVDWWQQYQDQKNIVRHELYGSALTDTEKREFDKANIHPGMSPQQISINLARQEAINKRAAAKLAKSYTASKRYDTGQVIEAVGGKESYRKLTTETPANTPTGAIRPRVKFTDLP